MNIAKYIIFICIVIAPSFTTKPEVIKEVSQQSPTHVSKIIQPQSTQELKQLLLPQISQYLLLVVDLAKVVKLHLKMVSLLIQHP